MVGTRGDEDPQSSGIRASPLGCCHIYILECFKFVPQKLKMALQPAMSVGVCIAWPRQTRTGFVRCPSVLCAKSYKIKKNRPTAEAAAAAAASSSTAGGRHAASPVIHSTVHAKSGLLQPACCCCFSTLDLDWLGSFRSDCRPIMWTCDQLLDPQSFTLAVAAVPCGLYRLWNACPGWQTGPSMQLQGCMVCCDVAYKPTQHEFLFC